MPFQDFSYSFLASALSLLRSRRIHASVSFLSRLTDRFSIPSHSVRSQTLFLLDHENRFAAIHYCENVYVNSFVDAMAIPRQPIVKWNSIVAGSLQNATHICEYPFLSNHGKRTN